MVDKETIRRQVWLQLQAVARPDSRFHWDFNRFIPDFTGSADCAARIREIPAYQAAASLMVTPDNSLSAFRASCLSDGKLLIVPTYGLGRGFLTLNRADVPAGQEAFAASLDGLEVYGRPYPLSKTDRPSSFPRPAVLVTGASVMNQQGIRISHGPSFFELEWLILSAYDLVDDRIPIITTIHDCQLVDFETEPLPYGIVTDRIITPTGGIETLSRYPRPGPSSIKSLPWQIIQDVPLLQELAE